MTREELFKYENNEVKQELLLDVANFCKCYVTSVCKKVVEHIDFILNDEAIKHLLHELRVREEQEQKEFNSDIAYMIQYGCSDIDVHNHCLTHAKSYRDVLYDLLVK